MQKILILDFGGQYNQLIARRVRECGVYCEVKPYTMTMDEIRAFDPIGIIFTGGPNSVYLETSPQVDPAIFSLGVPVLGICYGCQLMAHPLGGQVTEAQEDTAREYGKTETFYDTTCPLPGAAPGGGQLDEPWGLHGEGAHRLPPGGAHCRLPQCGHCGRGPGLLWGPVPPRGQPHPARHRYAPELPVPGLWGHGRLDHGDYKNRAIAQIREKVGDGKVLLALSGGVDSSVAAALLAEAVGSQLTCVFVDHGLMRKDEGDEVEAAFSRWDIHFARVDAEARFLGKLAGVSDPETKRKIIGEEFIRVFEDEAKKLGKVDYLVQGTIYPDVIESGAGNAAVIKSHHNVGGLPDYVDFREIIEPLRLLFKDEVRQLGRELGLPEYLVMRQPFPGPGLAIPGHWRDHQGKAGHTAGGGFHLPGRNRQGPPGGDNEPVFCRADQYALGGRNGRWPDIRLHPGPPLRHHHGLYDRRLDPDPLRCAGPGLRPYRQRGAPHQPHRLRYYQQTTGNH